MPERHDVINYIISAYKLQNPNYLEIGVQSGNTFRNVKSINKDGVDPCIYGKNQYINYEMLSDTFFSQNISKKYDLTAAQFALNWIVKKKKYLPLTHTLNKIRLLENINSIKKNIYTKDFNILEKKIFTKLQYTDTKKIIFFSKKSKTNYKNKKEALANRFGMIPSPINFSKNIKNNYIKPIRLKEKNINKVKKLYLIEGRLRFWAWIIAFGWKEKIPSLIWKE